MKQINWVSQFLTKRKFIPFLTVIFLLIPTIVYAQVIEPSGEQTEAVPLWPDKNKAAPPITPPINEHQGL